MQGLTVGGNEFIALQSVEANQRAQGPAMMMILTSSDQTGQHSSTGDCSGLLRGYFPRF